MDKKLFTIKINKIESILEYYYYLYKLWQCAKTLFEDQINMFIRVVSLGILNGLQVCKYENFTKLFEDAR